MNILFYYLSRNAVQKYKLYSAGLARNEKQIHQIFVGQICTAAAVKNER